MNSFLEKYPVKQYLIQLMLIFYVFFEIKITTIFIISIGVVWLLEKNFVKRLKSTVRNPYFFPFISFFLLNVLGLLWTKNLHEGFYFLEKRLTLFVMPFILGGLILSEKSVKNIIYTFIIACLSLCLIGLTLSFLKYLETGDTAYFYSDQLLRYMGGQGVYLGLYCNLALILLFYLYQSEYNFRVNKVFIIGLFIFFLIMVFLSASRNSILSIFLFSSGYLVYKVLKERQYKMAISGSVLILIAIISLSVIFPSTVKRFKSITNFEYSYDNTNPVNQFSGEIKKENWNGLTLRLAMWSCGAEVFRNNVGIGVGTGDYIDEVVKVYASRDFFYALERKWGVHNQYLETLISFGLLGLAVFVYCFIYPIFISYKKGNYLHVLFIVLFLIAFLTESVLNRFMGIVLFAIFNALLSFPYTDKKQDLSTS